MPTATDDAIDTHLTVVQVLEHGDGLVPLWTHCATAPGPTGQGPAGTNPARPDRQDLPHTGFAAHPGQPDHPAALPESLPERRLRGAAPTPTGRPRRPARLPNGGAGPGDTASRG